MSNNQQFIVGTYLPTEKVELYLFFRIHNSITIMQNVRYFITKKSYIIAHFIII